MKLLVASLVLMPLLVTNATCDAHKKYKILCVSHQFGSHMLMIHSVAEALIAQGHEVYTVFSDVMPVPKGLEDKGFKIVRYHSVHEIMASGKMKEKIVKDIFSNDASLDTTKAISSIANNECFDMDNDHKLNKQLRDQNFDLAIVDVFPPCQCMAHVPLKLNIPFISMQHCIEMEMMRVPAPPSFVPWPLFMYSDKMTFMQRLQNTVFTILSQAPPLSPFPASRNLTLLEKYNRDTNVKNWADLVKKSALQFLPRGPILEVAVPLMPNVIQLECLTCKPAKDLSPELQKMTKAADGIIVVSFGSQISELPDNVARKFLAGFAKRPELVLWRYTGKLPVEVPPNVKVMSWLPQNELLSHPKTKLFITHSGNNGQYESVYHGIPLLAFPLFAEQHHNAHMTVTRGYGLQCDITSLTSEELEAKIDRIILEAAFKEATQKAGNILKQQPMNAKEKAVYWIEHVLEFGSDHLHSYALKMPWYSFYMFDILLFFHVLVFVFIFVIGLLTLVVYRTLCSKSKSKVKTN